MTAAITPEDVVLAEFRSAVMESRRAPTYIGLYAALCRAKVSTGNAGPLKYVRSLCMSGKIETFVFARNFRRVHVIGVGWTAPPPEHYAPAYKGMNIHGSWSLKDQSK